MQLGRCRPLTDARIRANQARQLDHGFRIVHRQEDNFGGGRDQANLPRGRRAAHDGHTQIQDNHVGFELEDFVNRLLAIFGFTADVPEALK